EKQATADEKARVEGAVRWFATLGQLRAREKDAREAAEAADLARTAEAKLRAELADVEAAAVHKPVLAAADEAETAHIKALDARSARALEASEAIRLHEGAKVELAVKAAAFQEALAALDAARPALAEAARLDHLLDAA